MKKNCKNCNKEFITNDNRKNFCSRSCSCTYNNILRGRRSEETKRKISIGVKKVIKTNNSKIFQTGNKIIIKQCLFCGISHSHKNRLTCSDSCMFALRKRTLSNNLNKKATGGIRNGSGRGKSGWYKGIFCNSTYELAFVIYHLDNNLKIERYKGYFEYFDPIRNGIFKYYPDFKVNGEIIEIKGYKTQLDLFKLSGVPHNIKIKIMYKSDLKYIFDYIKDVYALRVENLFTLSSYRVKITKLCLNCNEEFVVNNDRKTFCCIKCSCSYTGRMNGAGRRTRTDIPFIESKVS